MPDILVKQLEKGDLPAADRIFRLAFGTLLTLPDPLKFADDADYIYQRWIADPTAAFGAYIDRELVGLNFVGTTGSVGHFGALTVHPQYWDKGVGKLLLDPTLELFERRKVTHIEFVTFADSPKHLTFYQKFGFCPRFLTPIMSTTVERAESVAGVIRFSLVADTEREAYLKECQKLTDAIYGGLDLTVEINAVHSQGLGDTLLIEDGDNLVGFVVCRCGAGSEAGSGSCMSKFGAVLPGTKAEVYFDRLLDACKAFTADCGASNFFTGVNTARYGAYHKMLEHGFRIEASTISMARPNQPAYNRPDVFLIDDWR